MVHVEQLRPDGDAALADLRRMAFGNTDAPDLSAPALAYHRTSCIYEGDRLIAVVLAPAASPSGSAPRRYRAAGSPA